MARIQIIAICASLLFVAYIVYLIVRGKLREEYAIVWIVCTAILLVFSFWRNGLEIVSDMFGVYEAPNLVFTGAILAMLIYLLHLSVVNSKLQDNNKSMAQRMALLEQQLEELKRKTG